MPDSGRLFDFIGAMERLVERGSDEATLLHEGAGHLAALVRHDDWLNDAMGAAPASGYAQYLLHCDPRGRFCVVSFVWAPGARTPIHDHTVWGMVGVMRGAENCYEYDPPRAGSAMRARAQHRMEPGQIDRVSPRLGDLHVVENALADQPSLSIHVYGGDIGRIERHVYDAQTGEARRFVSGYSNR